MLLTLTYYPLPSTHFFLTFPLNWQEVPSWLISLRPCQEKAMICIIA